MNKIILLKLGGSLITDKTREFTARTDIINDLARQIREAIAIDKNLRLIIGNGAGSFAHYPAMKYKMTEGIKNEKQKKGFCLVQDAASQLNRLIIESFIKNEICAVSLNPSSMIVSKKGQIKDFFLEPLFLFLKLNITPVMYGDIVVDENLGAHIYSTERLLAEVARRLMEKNMKIHKIIHNGITRGVLDSKGELVKKISFKNWERLRPFFYKTQGYDVTGGMLHKIEESLKLTKYGLKTLIINGTAEKNLLKKALLDEEVAGTLVE